MRFYTADLHLGHVNIREYCEARLALGDDVEAMNRELIARWNETVGAGDQVIILGDLCMGKIADTLPLAAQLNGYKYLFPGNHDRMFAPKNASARKRWVAAYKDAGVTPITLTPETPMSMMMGKYLVYVSHFPYEGDSHDEDRFKDYRPIDGGYVLLHGHVHDGWKINRNQINVGVDAWDYRPVSEDQIAYWVEQIRNSRFDLHVPPD